MASLQWLQIRNKCIVRRDVSASLERWRRERERKPERRKEIKQKNSDEGADKKFFGTEFQTTMK